MVADGRPAKQGAPGRSGPIGSTIGLAADVTTAKDVMTAKAVRLNALLSAIDREIMPVLARSHGFEGNHVREDVDQSDIVWFAQLLIADDRDTIDRFLERLRKREWTVERIYIDFLTRVAMHLGEAWLLDQMSFAQVTIGTARLRQIMADLTQGFYDEGEAVWVDRGQVLLAPVTGEQHNFGIAMVAAFFRRAGWRVVQASSWADGEVGASSSWIGDRVAHQHFDIVGLSVASVETLGALKADIATIRRRSRKPDCRVIVGGPAVNGMPSLANDVGADDFALDAVQALVVAERLVPRPANATSHPRG